MAKAEQAEPAVPAMADREARESQVAEPPRQIEDLIRETFPECPDTMIAIARAESSMRADAVNVNRNGSLDCGILQINSIHGYDCDWLKIPENNIKAGRKVFDDLQKRGKDGRTAWETFKYL